MEVSTLRGKVEVTFQKACVFSIAGRQAIGGDSEATPRVLYHMRVRTLYAYAYLGKTVKNPLTPIGSGRDLHISPLSPHSYRLKAGPMYSPLTPDLPPFKGGCYVNKGVDEHRCTQWRR